MLRRTIWILTLLALTGGSRTGTAQETDYKPYQPGTTKTRFFEISYDSDRIEFTAPSGDKDIFIGHFRRNLVIRDRAVYFDEIKMFDAEGVYIDEKLYPWDEIYDIRVSRQGDRNRIAFYRKSDAEGRAAATRRGNIIKYADNITIDEDEFVRGMVFSALGDIRVDGEVNRDIVSLFGDVNIGPGAVARGDLASITGDIDVGRGASIYGEKYGKDKFRRSRRRGRFYRDYDISLNSVTGGFVYNRVDGAHPWIQYTYDDGGYLPQLELQAGYAFASSRWRFNVQIQQTLLRDISLSLGGRFYRRLESEDMWIFEKEKHFAGENTVFALLATEDFMDYYESDGGALYLKARPMRDLRLEAGYHVNETNWLVGHSHLWSVFGGDKLFSPNFSKVDLAFREDGIREIDSSSNASLRLRVDYDTRDDREPFSKSAWAATAALEWSSPDFNSDFDYRRYTVNVRRYQQINRRTMVMLRLMYGGSDGYLPMHKRFYMGGLGTLRGYYHKEYMGTKYWLGNAEYRFNFRRSALALAVLYDIGQMANDQKLDGDVEIKQSIGVALYLGDDARMSLARRLDRSEDNTPKFYVRLSHVL